MQPEKFWIDKKLVVFSLLFLLVFVLVCLRIFYLPSIGHSLHLQANWLFESDRAQGWSVRPSFRLYKTAYFFGDDLAKVAFNIGLCYNEETKYLEALRWFDHALAIDPDYGHALYLKGKTLELSSQTKEGERITRLYVKHYPKDPDGWVVLGNCLYRERKFVEAARSFKQAVELEKDIPYRDQSLWWAAHSYESAKLREEADAELKMLVALKAQRWETAEKRLDLPLAQRQMPSGKRHTDEWKPLSAISHLSLFLFLLALFGLLSWPIVSALKRHLTYVQILLLNTPLFLSAVILDAFDTSLGMPFFICLLVFFIPLAWLIFKGKGKLFFSEAIILSFFWPALFALFANGLRGLAPWIFWFERFGSAGPSFASSYMWLETSFGIAENIAILLATSLFLWLLTVIIFYDAETKEIST